MTEAVFPTDSHRHLKHSCLIFSCIIEGIRIKGKKIQKQNVQIYLLPDPFISLKTSLLWIYTVSYYLQNHKTTPLIKIRLYVHYIKIT